MSKTWGERVQEVMDAKDWSGAELGRRVGVSKAAVSAWIRGHSGPSPETVFALADASGYSARYLALGTGPKMGKHENQEAHSLWLAYCSAAAEIRQAVDLLLRKPDKISEEKASQK